jgi:tetratricopeptide (TPR) repeat protein
MTQFMLTDGKLNVASGWMKFSVPEDASSTFVAEPGTLIYIGDYRGVYTTSNYAGYVHFSFWIGYIENFSLTLEELLKNRNDFSALTTRNQSSNHYYAEWPLVYSKEFNYSRSELMAELDAANQAIALNPQDVSNYRIRAKIYYELQDYEKSLEDCSYLIELDPDNSGLYYHARAVVYVKMEKYPEALTDISKIVEYNPLDHRHYSLSAASLYAMKMYQAAIIAYTKVAELGHINYYNYYLRGDAHQRLGKYEEAIADYTKAIEIRPNAIAAFISRGSVWLTLRMPDKALYDINNVCRLSLPEGNLYGLRGLAYSLNGNYLSALSDITRAIEYNPGNANWYNLRATVYVTMAETSRRSVKEEYLRRARRDNETAARIRAAGN